MKAAQMGLTETAINRVFWTMDVRRLDVLYVLPNQTPDAGDFSSARFDAALQESPHIAAMFSSVKNIGHKMAGSVNLYIRGSQSPTALKSIPVGFVVLDEVAEMSPRAVALAEERLSGQMSKQIYAISTPLVAGTPLSTLWNESSQDEFFFRCPHCSQFITLKYPDNIVITADSIVDPKIANSHYICNKCKKEIPHEGKHKILQTGQWVSKRPHLRKDNRGFGEINQLYSSTVTPMQIAKAVIRARTDRAAEQELYNSKLGREHEVAGARLAYETVEECIRGHQSVTVHDGRSKIVTMGVDVGSVLHVVFCEFTFDRPAQGDANSACTSKVIRALKVDSFEDLDSLILDMNPRAVVVDANPERRSATNFALRHYGRAMMCLYHATIAARDISIKDEDMMVLVNRTAWLDTVLNRFKSKRIALPYDIGQEFKDHITAQCKVYSTDADGNPAAKYVNGSRADHYAHALLYAEVALKIAVSRGEYVKLTG
jgi:DNA-directed RNA polymerase subunit RPC12/RpoP